jgi:hypothetical protein
MNKRLSTLLKISKTGFLACRSQRLGGAIYPACRDFDLAKSCFDTCTAAEHAAFFESSSGVGDSSDIWLTVIGDQVDGSIICVENDHGSLNATQNFDIASSAGCWVLMPRRTTSRPSPALESDGGGITFSGVLALIVICVAVIGSAYLGLT